MNAGTRKFDLGSSTPADRNPQTVPVRSNVRDKTDTDRLRIVRIDEPEFLNGKLLDEAAKFARSPHRPPSDHLNKNQAAHAASASEEIGLETISSREPGVDLVSLQSPDVDTAQLAAFTQKVAPAKSRSSHWDSEPTDGKPVVMPLAKTDLLDIFHDDKVCMVTRPKHNAPTLDVEEESHQLPPPPATCSTLSQQKTPYLLDRTQQYLVENWDKLPPNVQAAILNVIDAAISPDEE